MRRTRLAIALVIMFVSASVGVGRSLGQQDCRTTPEGQYICHITGTMPIINPGDPGSTPIPGGEPAPLEYFKIAIDPVVGECWYWSTIPGGLDSSDPANDATIIFTILSLPSCPGATGIPGTGPTIDELAWDVLRSFTLATPQPIFAPPDSGITGLATYLGHDPIAELDYSETLPGGIALVVRAFISEIGVDWGDGTRSNYLIDDLVGEPSAAISHMYDLKTCTPEYREEHPSGGLCHPTLEAYPVTIAFNWVAGYEYDTGWVQLQDVELTQTTLYDVDEVVGIVTQP